MMKKEIGTRVLRTLIKTLINSNLFPNGVDGEICERGKKRERKSRKFESR